MEGGIRNKLLNTDSMNDEYDLGTRNKEYKKKIYNKIN